MKFVIPSYQRSDKLAKKTLKYLCDNKVPASDTYIFIRDDDSQREEYLDLGIDYKINIVITNVKGIGKTHNTITETFDEGEFIVEIDDDMTSVIDNFRKPVDFLKTCDLMKKNMTEVGASYGGTYQCDNTMFMSQCKEFTYDLKYCLGCLRFRFIRKEIVLETNFSEDFENCIQHYIRDGVIVKNNWIAPKTSNYSSGGCDGDGRNVESEKIDKEFLANKYPNHCKLFQRKNGRYDLRLKHKK